MIVISILIEKDTILILYINIEIFIIMRYLSRLHKECLLNRGMSYPETKNNYNTLIESKIYRTSISFVISFAYIAISNCARDTIFF